MVLIPVRRTGICTATLRTTAAGDAAGAADQSPRLVSSLPTSPDQVSQALLEREQKAISRLETELIRSCLQLDGKDELNEEDPFAAVEAEELGDTSDGDELAPELLIRDQLARQATLVTDLVEALGRECWREGCEGKRAALQLVRDQGIRPAQLSAYTPGLRATSAGC